jgi:hypothetical protein
VSHVTVSGAWGEKGKVSHVTVLLCFALLLLCIALPLLEAGTRYGLVALLCFALPLRCHM